MPKQEVTRRWDDAEQQDQVALVGFFAQRPAQVWALKRTLSVGRVGSSCDIQIPSGVVSANHGQIGEVSGKLFYRDLGSSNGTWFGGRRIERTIELREGSALCFASAAKPTDVVFRLVVARVPAQGFSWRKVSFADNVQEVVLGRGQEGVSIADAYVSERHASFFHSAKGPYVLDHMSTNGVFVNGTRIEGSAPVHACDVVRIGQTLVYVLDDALWVGECEAPVPPKTTPLPVPTPQVRDTPRAVPRDVPRAIPAKQQDVTVPGQLIIDIEEKNVWSRFKSKTILRDVHLTVDPGDFVLILGGSGAGKTTFLKAVMGDDKATGTVRLGDMDVYEEYEQIKYQIGYVPQQDLLRYNDTVHETLFAAARLRMPSRATKEETEERVVWASELLGLSREMDTMVGRLSGGQRKRLSIAVELVGDPTIFFLDEPDSGLDGVMARALMDNLRSIADLGKMVVVITHGPDRAAELFSKVIVLAKSERDGSGHLIFFGSVDEAKAFFEVKSLEGVVRRINRPDEGGEGRADEYLNKWEESHE